ncbi:hypothetical protein AMTR_s00164p00027140 [Amborella trichopoda]|uniref:Uncharacterized protein n=1 Tax=Amborella trichopoda TaxID=13333 RepID=W1PT65_AMBTC|nr:hypothetical protein AMTR_s00164p00027140 [Amborella trichopoda]
MHCQSTVASATLLPERIHRVPQRNVSKRCTARAKSCDARANSLIAGANYHTAEALWLQKVCCRSHCLYRRSVFLYHWSDVINRPSALAPEGLLPE